MNAGVIPHGMKEGKPGVINDHNEDFM